MIKIVTTTVFALTALIFIAGGLNITINPFSIKMTNWRGFIGWILLIIGIALVSTEHGLKQYKKGCEDMSKMFVNEIKEKQNE